MLLSPGRSVGLRMVPTIRDLRFAWEEMPQQLARRAAAKNAGELARGADSMGECRGRSLGLYRTICRSSACIPSATGSRFPIYCATACSAGLLAKRPGLKYLLLHNIDTLGADAAPALLGLHKHLGGCLTFEVITRRIDDRGGGLARVDGRLRLVEGLVMPREEDEFQLSYYNSMSTWITIDRLLAAFGLSRDDLADAAKVKVAVRAFAGRLAHLHHSQGCEKAVGPRPGGCFPVAQFEKLWGDMTSLPDIESRFVAVPRARGQQLKDQAQLDGWLRDGSAAAVEALCEWE